MRCHVCGREMVYVGKNTYFCEPAIGGCGHSRKEEMPRLSPYERTKSQVYATGNKWAIENFHATHN